MSWLKVDDGFNTHPKVCRLDDEFAPQIAMNARAVWLTVGVYCAHARSPFVEVGPLRKLLPCSREELSDAIAALVTVGLIDDTDHGFEVHDWGHYVPPSSTERVKEHRERKRAKHVETVTRVSETVTRVTGNTETLPLPSPPGPSRPDPAPPLSSSLRSELCRTLNESDQPAKVRKANKRAEEKAKHEAQARELIAFWQKELDYPKRGETDERISVLCKRLAELEKMRDPEDPSTDPMHVMRTAIVGILKSPFHNGQNTTGEDIHNLESVFRKHGSIDRLYVLGAAEVERREKPASRREPEPTMPIAGPEPALGSIENKETTGRSFEQLNRFYEALNGTNEESVKKLEEYLLRYPDDEQAAMHLALKQGTP